MTQLDKFKRELMLKRYALSTMESYSGCLTVLLSKFGDKPTIEQLKDFLITIKNRNTHKQYVATIRHYFNLVLNKKISLKDIPYPRKSKYLPEILSVDEVKRIIDIPKNHKHQSIICLLYGCGLRVSELINLKIYDIDSDRMIINIRGAKGNKDRQVMLDRGLLILLRNYFKRYKPETYLFNGQFRNQYSERSVNELLKYYAKRAGIKKRVHAHLLRHCFATHLMESGVDRTIIGDLLGHSSLKSTAIYTRLSKKHIANIQSPLVAIIDTTVQITNKQQWVTM